MARQSVRRCMPSIAILDRPGALLAGQVGQGLPDLRDRLFQRAPVAPRKASQSAISNIITCPRHSWPRPHRIDPCEVAVEGDAGPRLLGVERTTRRGRRAQDRLIHFAEDPPGKERFEGIGQVRNSRTRRQPPRHAGYGTGKNHGAWHDDEALQRDRGAWQVEGNVGKLRPARRDRDRIRRRCSRAGRRRRPPRACDRSAAARHERVRSGQI